MRSYERNLTRGKPDSEFVIVGEAPGKQELVKGVPFIGPSGKLLEKALASAEYSSDLAYVTNVFHFLPDDGIDDDLMEDHRPYLLEELGRYPRRVILSLGSTAYRTITGDYRAKITQTCGVARSVDLPGNQSTTLVPALHPAAILRGARGTSQQQWYDNIAYAVSLVKGGSLKSPGNTRYMVCKSREQVVRVIDGLLKYVELAADIETDGLDFQRSSILSLGVSWAKNLCVIFTGDQLRDEVLAPHFHKLFDAPIRWIWHNGKFDVKFINHLGYRASFSDDTMLMHYALDETKGTHGLKQLASDKLGAPDYDKDLLLFIKKKSDSFALIPPVPRHRYNAYDADYTGQLKHVFRQLIDRDPKLAFLYDKLLMPAARMLNRVEEYGFAVDVDAAEKLRRELEEVKLDLEMRAQGWIGYEFNMASPQQLKKIIYEQLCLKPDPSKYRPGALFSENTSDDSLFLLEDNAFVDLVRQWRDADKVLSTYVLGIINRLGTDGRIHCQFLLHGTETGRLSSKEPNLQNIPVEYDSIKSYNSYAKNVKNILVAPIGCKLISLDYSQLELRMLALLSGEPELKRIYLNDRDLHSELSLSTFGDTAPHHRSWCKTMNFGVMYGMGEHKMRIMTGASLLESRRIVQSWYARFPIAKRFMDDLAERPVKGENVITPFGRVRRFGMYSPDRVAKATREARATVVQATASDITLLAACAIDEYIDRMWSARIVNLVHDNIVVECPNEYVDECVHLVKEVMESIPRKLLKADIPFTAEAKVGQTWATVEKYSHEAFSKYYASA